MTPLFASGMGSLYVGDAKDVLPTIDSGSVDLILTSTPFPMITPKRALKAKYTQQFRTEYEYWQWMEWYADEFRRLLTKTGSLVIEAYPIWVPKEPRVSLWAWRFPFFFEARGFKLIQDLWVSMKNRLPTPTEWVGVRKIRFRQIVNPLWWFSLTEHPKIRIDFERTGVRPHQREAAKTDKKFIKRDAGHTFLPESEGKVRGYRLPGNVFERSSNADRTWVRELRARGRHLHPARFPESLVARLIERMTDPGDLVLDPFAGSCTVGWIAEKLGRRWINIEIDPAIAGDGALRWASKLSETKEGKNNHHDEY